MACDVVITGEGKVDEQTFSGKVVAHVVSLANQNNKPFIILCGQCTLTTDELQKYGAGRIISLVNHPSELKAAIANPVPLIKSRVQKAFLNLT
jgi:glycerate kinase